MTKPIGLKSSCWIEFSQFKNSTFNLNSAPTTNFYSDIHTHTQFIQYRFTILPRKLHQFRIIYRAIRIGIIQRLTVTVTGQNTIVFCDFRIRKIFFEISEQFSFSRVTSIYSNCQQLIISFTDFKWMLSRKLRLFVYFIHSFLILSYWKSAKIICTKLIFILSETWKPNDGYEWQSDLFSLLFYLAKQ